MRVGKKDNLVHAPPLLQGFATFHCTWFLNQKIGTPLRIDFLADLIKVYIIKRYIFFGFEI